MNSPLNRLLLNARIAYERCGFIPYGVAVALRERGVIVPELEDHWSRNEANR
jgi:hypothetical protein